MYFQVIAGLIRRQRLVRGKIAFPNHGWLKDSARPARSAVATIYSNILRLSRNGIALATFRRTDYLFWTKSYPTYMGASVDISDCDRN